MEEPSVVERLLNGFGLLLMAVGALLMTLTVIGLAVNAVQLGFNAAHNIAGSSTEPGDIFATGVGLLFGSEVLKRLRQIAGRRGAP